MASNESKTLWIAGAALLAFAGMMVWVLMGTGEGESDPELSATPAASSLSPPAASAPAAVAAKKPTAVGAQPAQPALAAAPVDPMADLFAGPMPDFMVDIHTLVLDKKPLNVEAQKLLYNFGKEHKDDARPQLLLAWDSMNREWEGIAVRMYRIAYHADPRAKNDPRMLSDLLSIASRFDKTEYRETTAIILEAYGDSALPAIDEQIESLRNSGQLARSERLERLRTAIKNAPR